MKVQKLEDFVDGSQDAFAMQQLAVRQQLAEAAAARKNLEDDLSNTKLVAVRAPTYPPTPTPIPARWLSRRRPAQAEMAADNRKLAAGVEAANELLKAHGVGLDRF